MSFDDSYGAVDWTNSFHIAEAEIEADLNKPLPIDLQVVDSVNSLSVLEKLCDLQVMLNEAFRMLKEGGSLVLRVPWQWSINKASHDYPCYRPYGLEYCVSGQASLILRLGLRPGTSQ